MRRKAPGAFSRNRGKPMERSSVPIWAQTLVPQTHEITLNRQIAGCYWSIFLVGEGHWITTRSELEIKDIHIYSMDIFGTVPLLYGQCRGDKNQVNYSQASHSQSGTSTWIRCHIESRINACRTQILSLTSRSIMGLILFKPVCLFCTWEKKKNNKQIKYILFFRSEPSDINKFIESLLAYISICVGAFKGIILR